MTNWLDKIIPPITLPEGENSDWVIKRVEIKPDPIQEMRARQGGRNYVPGIYTNLMRDGTLVMNDSPDEREDHISFVRAATGSVLISGLGLGMCLAAVLRKAEVTDVTVLELSQDLIDLVAHHYQDPRIEIICADALEWKPPKGKKYGAVWHDIWDDMCTDNLPGMGALNRRYARKADWKGCWGQEYTVMMRNRERVNQWGY